MVATIGDVARAAGVSRSTVSYALSGKRAISLETQQRIQDAIRSLDFTVNAGARALATQRTMVLGLLVHFDPDEFAPAMMEYVLPVTARARLLGYDILMVTERDGASALARVMSAGMVDGVILLSVSTDDDRLPILRRGRQPGVVIGLPQDPTGIDVFDLDFAEAATVTLEHLRGLGHEKVAVIVPPRHVFERGGTYGWRFRDTALAAAEILGMDLRVRHAETTAESIEPMFAALLDEEPDTTALIVHSDRTAAMLPGILGRLGVSVPQDLSVITLHSAGFARDFSVPYTYIETGPAELAARVVDLLVDRIADPRSPAQPAVTLLEARLVDRGSVLPR
ncbi:LacI family transcriptional regulator [Clavibacter michiganensis]|nr:LacI family transcriptional regulator [Clavibacter michiganensis]